MASVLWLRRDLRRGDHPALAAAAEDGPVLALFVIDPVLWRSAGPVRRAWVAASVLAARESYDRRLLVRVGDPVEVVAEVAARLDAASVTATGETTPYGRDRDRRVEAALGAARVRWQPVGTPYAVDPGTVLTRTGTPYQVFTPFARAWRGHGWAPPSTEPDGLELLDPSPHERRAGGDGLAMLDHAVRQAASTALPDAGEQAAEAAWRRFLDRSIGGYGDGRDRPDLDATSRLSPYLKVGAIHPRTLLADLDERSDRDGEDVERFVTELAWREFYADVLWHRPDSAWADLRPTLRDLAYDDPAGSVDLIDAWRQGRTGFPIVDAGMRQLLTEGWMHNRVRMIVASFFAKDLHLWWPLGARHFLDHLIDGDLASNNHGWQWTAGTGTDPSPYFRVFNPTAQGIRFDPTGDYVRRYVPELAHLDGAVVHEPATHPDGHRHGYPTPILDHAEERAEALQRYGATRT